MSNLTDYKNIWVFIETECGKPKNVGYELLNVAKPLAETKGCELVAVVIGNNIENVAKDAICYGADSAIIVDREEYEMYMKCIPRTLLQKRLRPWWKNINRKH